MSTGRVICENPNTLTGIIPFFETEDHEQPVREHLKGIEHLFVNDITPITLPRVIPKEIKRKLAKGGKIYHNGQQYSYDTKSGKVEFQLIRSEGKTINYKDGILQDMSTGELFYFLAIDNLRSDPKEEVVTKLIDEGTIVNYKRQYIGIGEIRLHKLNSKYYYENSNLTKYLEDIDKPKPNDKTAKKAIKDLKKYEKVIEDLKKHEKAIEDIKKYEKAIKDLKKHEKAIKDIKKYEKAIKDIKKHEKAIKDLKKYDIDERLEGEIVRFVEIVGVEDYPGPKRKP